MEGGVHVSGFGGVIVSSPGHDKGEERWARHHQLYHKGEGRFAVPAASHRQSPSDAQKSQTLSSLLPEDSDFETIHVVDGTHN